MWEAALDNVVREHLEVILRDIQTNEKELSPARIWGQASEDGEGSEAGKKEPQAGSGMCRSRALREPGPEIIVLGVTTGTV